MRHFYLFIFLQIAVPAYSQIKTFDAIINNSTLDRDIKFRVTYKENISQTQPVILISHGGTGSVDGHTKFEHLTFEYAQNGYLTISLNHFESETNVIHRFERPMDVSYLIDRLFQQTLPLPNDYQGKPDTSKIGHIGHSWGAYTTLALAGGIFEQGTFLDNRIKAHVAMSPQGADQFGSYDNGAADNTWMNIVKPVYNILGEGEKDGSGQCSNGGIQVTDWRLQPFQRYPETGDKFQSIIPEACHYHIGDNGTQDHKDYIASNSRLFFDVYLKNQVDQICRIGYESFIEGTDFDKKFDSNLSDLENCKTSSNINIEDLNFSWQTSLIFDETNTPPQPSSAFNLVQHHGKLYAGFGTVKDGGLGNKQSYIYRKDNQEMPWQLDATFPENTLRVDAMSSITFSTGIDGEPLQNGPVTKLIAVTNKVGNDLQPLRAFIRDDATGEWIETIVSNTQHYNYQSRQITSHRDKITGVDYVLIAASPSPLGVFAGYYDPTVPGEIQWINTPEFTGEENQGSEKWFGMDNANGVLYLSDKTGIFKRNDGPNPYWERVSNNESSGVANPEIRGLTAVPNPKEITGWPEKEMLIFSWQSNIWRMRAGGDFAQVKELDLINIMEDHIQKPVLMVEAAFNTINSFRLEEKFYWLISFQTVFGDVNFQEYLGAANPFTVGEMNGKAAVTDQAYFLVRDKEGNYSSVQEIYDPEIQKSLILARDLISSPFDEKNIFAAGYNVSMSAEHGPGKGWVYEGNLREIINNIDPLQELSELKVYPNPGEGMIRVSYNGTIQKGSNISLYDLQGKLLMRSLISTEGEKSFDLSGLNKGVYLFKLNTGDKTLQQKLIIR